MNPRSDVAWPAIILVSAAAAAAMVNFIVNKKTGNNTDNEVVNSKTSQYENTNAALNANDVANISLVNSTSQADGEFPPVNNDPNANTNLANISPQTNANSDSASRKSCTIDSDCGLLVCSGCFSNEYLKTAPPDLACRTYEGYRCACVAGQCLEAQ